MLRLHQILRSNELNYFYGLLIYPSNYLLLKMNQNFSLTVACWQTICFCYSMQKLQSNWCGESNGLRKRQVDIRICLNHNARRQSRASSRKLEPAKFT